MRPPQGGGRASTSASYRAALRFATWWLRRYTRGVDPRIAEDREAEAAIELWEHADVADTANWSGPHAAATLVVRTAAGMSRDWSWQRATIESGGPPPLSPIRLVSRRRRSHFWVPLQQGHVFDQANGMMEPEKALPYEGPGGTFRRR
jgi:hypothetical protein